MSTNRRSFTKWLGAVGLAGTGLHVHAGKPRQDPHPEDPDPMDASRPMPVLFVGHGSPMNAVERNTWSEAFQALGRRISKPKAVLVVSAHWWTPGTLLTGEATPRTIHDFSGFPKALYEIEYPAPGQPDLARRVQSLLEQPDGTRIGLSEDWGLDHGSWSLLRHMIPDASVPVIQLSLSSRLTPQQHFELARGLGDLRSEGVLILGSGNITHNLRDAITRTSEGDRTTPEWASQFDERVKGMLEAREASRLVAAWPDGPHAKQAHPHPDHWLPLLYAFAATDAEDDIEFPIEGFDMGSLSMRAVLWEPARKPA